MELTFKARDIVKVAGFTPDQTNQSNNNLHFILLENKFLDGYFKSMKRIDCLLNCQSDAIFSLYSHMHLDFRLYVFYNKERKTVFQSLRGVVAGDYGPF